MKPKTANYDSIENSCPGKNHEDKIDNIIIITLRLRR